MIDLRGKAVLITGGTMGIGLGIGLSFGRLGARCTLTYHWGSADEEAILRAFAQAGAPAPRLVRADVASAEQVQKYSEATISANDPQDRYIQDLIYHYILQNLAPDPKTGRRRRVMMLLFRGEDAVRKTRSVIGNITAERRGGETIRDTYGDLITDENNQVRYFEPAVLAARFACTSRPSCGAFPARCRSARSARRRGRPG